MLRSGLLFSLFFFVASFAAAQEKIDGKLIVGKWEPAKAPPGAKVVMEFTKDDKIKVEAEINGQKIKMEGSYKLEGDTLTLKMAIDNRPEISTSLKVVKLNNDEMVTKEGDKQEETLKRLKN